MYNFCLSDTGTDAIINILNKNGEALWPESKPNGFDPSNLIQIMLAQENMRKYIQRQVLVFINEIWYV